MLFGNAFGWPHLLIILAIILLIFGAPKLPQLARSISQSIRIFRSEVKTDKGDDAAAPYDATQPTAADLAAQQAAADAAARQVAAQQAAARQAAAQQGSASQPTTPPKQ